jgi:uncharacterized protein YjbI with pentapeptide repeats
MMMGERIAVLRRQANVSQSELGQRLSVTAQAVGKWERGECEPDFATLTKIADIFGADLNYFVTGQSAEQPSAGIHGKKSLGFNMSMSEWADGDFSNIHGLAEKFMFANIRGSKFINSGLSGLTLKCNNIKDSDFTGADISGSKLHMCEISKSVFINCNFTGSTVSFADIKNSNFDGANFTGAVFKHSDIKNISSAGAKWTQTSLLSTVFVNMCFDGAVTNCVFDGAGFKNVIFKNVVFNNTFFKNCKFKNVSFENCRADNISMTFLRNAYKRFGVLQGVEQI